MTLTQVKQENHLSPLLLIAASMSVSVGVSQEGTVALLKFLSTAARHTEEEVNTLTQVYTTAAFTHWYPSRQETQ